MSVLNPMSKSVSQTLSALLLSLPLACSSSGSDTRADLPPDEYVPDHEVSEPVSQAATSDAVMRWDHRPEADMWTVEAMHVALNGAGQPLISVVPQDISAWCPTYPTNSSQQRATFWVGLLSAMAKHESTWNPEAVGGGGQWFGLVQISPATAKGYGCGATSGEALKSGSANLSCALRIMAHTVPRDGVVAQNMRGVAADWGPFHSAAKRAEMAAWTSSQSYCR